MESRHHPTLVLARLADGYHPGLSAVVGKCMEEAACLCLEEQGHSSGVALRHKWEKDSWFTVEWEHGDSKKWSSWDKDQATEWGASGIAILLIHFLTGLRVIERAQKGDRIDYWLGETHDDDPPFIGTERLEVSGIRKDDESRVMSRVKEKLRRLSLANSELPAIVVVIEFGTPMSHMERK